MKFYSLALMMAVGCSIACAQSADALLQQQSAQLMDRSAQLLEYTQGTIPGLVRASAPLSEDAKQTLIKLKANGRPLPSDVYAYLGQLRTYLVLADALQKPTPFSDEARRQFSELRTNVDLLEGYFRVLMVRTEAQIRPVDRDNLCRYTDANSKLAPPSAAKHRVLFYGDSITDAWRLNEYFPDQDYVNRGISGQITGEMLGRLQADVIANKPEAMIILAGTNDLARNVQVATVKNNIQMIAELAEAHKIQVILSSILPVSDHHKDKNPRYENTKVRPPDKIREINAWMVDYAKQKGFIYCDYYDALVDPTGQIQAELAADGLHPNADGYKIMAPIAQMAIDRALKQAQNSAISVQQKATKKRPSL